jgi:initiation factor 1A
MPKKHKGNNNTRRMAPKKLPIEYADKSVFQEYGYISDVLGNCHFKIKNIDGDERVGSLSGTVKRNGKIKIGDLVLIEPLTDNLNSKFQVIFKYTPEQKKILENEGLLIKIINPENENKENINPDDANDNAMASAFAFESQAKEAQMEKEMEIINDLFVDGI